MEDLERGQIAAVQRRLQQLDEEISRESDRLEALKTEAETQGQRVTQKPGDEAAQAQLRENEHEIARLRKYLRVLDTERKDLRARANTYRLQEQNARGQEIREQIKEWRARQKELKSKLIPEAELALARMQEELKQLEERIAKAGEDLKTT